MPSHIGQYRILRKIGAGGMGLVFLGEHTLLGRRAAIKTLLPTVAANHEIVERFFNEARATSSIADPGVIQIFDFGYHVDGTAYIVMELLEGESLSARIERLGKLSLGDALRVARQIACSLAAAHAKDIVHRDLKPENIFLVRDAEAQGGERTKIIDFGVCKIGAGDPALTEVGAMIGTPVYMSPEQCRGAGSVDARSDIYSFGCLVFHLITGRPPFIGEASGDLIVAHLQNDPPRATQYVPELPAEVDDLLLRCLAKAPDERFASITEILPVLAQLAEHPDAAVAAVIHSAPTVPLGRGFRSVYDANMAARFGSAFGSPPGSPPGSAMSHALRPRLRFGATPPGTPQTVPPPVVEEVVIPEIDELDAAPPPRAGVRAALACVLVVGVTLGLVVTPLVSGDDEHPARSRPPAAAPAPRTIQDESIDPETPAAAPPAALLANTGRGGRSSAIVDDAVLAASGEPARSSAGSRGSREAAHGSAASASPRRGRSPVAPSRPVTSPSELPAATMPRAAEPVVAPSAAVRSPEPSPAPSIATRAPEPAATQSAPAKPPTAPPAAPPPSPARTAPAPAAGSAPAVPTEDLYDTR
ncbi:MAG TPA: protein kinase [Kofleriaceae bacterium]